MLGDDVGELVGRGPDHGQSRQAGEEVFLVALLRKPVVENDDDAGVCLGADEAAETLPEPSTASGR